MHHDDFVAALKRVLDLRASGRADDAVAAIDRLVPALEEARGTAIDDWHIAQAIALRADVLGDADPKTRQDAHARHAEFCEQVLTGWVRATADARASLAVEVAASGAVGRAREELRRAESLLAVLGEPERIVEGPGSALARARAAVE